MRLKRRRRRSKEATEASSGISSTVVSEVSYRTELLADPDSVGRRCVVVACRRSSGRSCRPRRVAQLLLREFTLRRTDLSRHRRSKRETMGDRNDNGVSEKSPRHHHYRLALQAGIVNILRRLSAAVDIATEPPW